MPDDLIAALEQIQADLNDGAVYPRRTLEWHAPRLLAAERAALKLADEWEQRAANHEQQAKALRDNGGMIVPAAQEARAQTYRANAQDLREAIRAAMES